MKPSKYDKQLDELITRTLGRETPAFDFDKWKQNHQKEIRIFKSQTGQIPHFAQPFKIWRIIMKSPITKLAAAAVIIIAVLIGINQFSGSIDMAGVAWADVARKVEKIHTFIYRTRRSATSGPKKEGFEFIEPDTENIVYRSLSYGTRTDSYQSGKLRFSIYTLFQEKAIVSVLHLVKEYTRYPLPYADVGGIDPREMVKQILSNEYTELGRKTIDGLQVEAVELDGQWISGERLENAATRLWVDVETGLPVRIELEGVAYGTPTKVKVVQDEFQWNVRLEASDFEPNIPPDYIFVESEMEPEGDLAVEQEIQELDLSNLEDLHLLGLEDIEPDIIVPLVGMKEIWRAQDEIVSTWPEYSGVREQLYGELLEKLDLDNLLNEQLFATGVTLREKFWEMGGCLSEVSYPYGYAARILFEMAYDEDPDNITATDELVETIQSVELAWKYEADSDERIRNIALRDTLMELRMAQFEQIKRELEEGRMPIWEDFVRVNDLAILSGIASDYEDAQETTEWLIHQAEQGGWIAYMGPLENMRRCFNEGKRFNYNIYLAQKSSFPEEFRYGRRLPSFRGPKKRSVVPVHMLKANPIWHGH